MLDKIHDLYEEMEHHKVMLSFKGGLTPELITAMLGLVERKMSHIEPDIRIRKRVFNVVTECLQNLYHHNLRTPMDDGGLADFAERHGVVMIAHLDHGYSVLTGNFMSGDHVAAMTVQLDKINALPPEELRAFYRSTLADGTYTSSGGGGLGMIDIARKSGGKLEYGFVPYDKDNAFFSLNVNVNT